MSEDLSLVGMFRVVEALECGVISITIPTSTWTSWQMRIAPPGPVSNFELKLDTPMMIRGTHVKATRVHDTIILKRYVEDDL